MAQQIQPRIVGLEKNSTYMTLLQEDNTLTTKEESITIVIDSLRNVYRAEGSVESRDKIIALENQLFELRARKATVVDSLNIIEQKWVLNNVGAVRQADTNQASEHNSSTEDIKFIYQSPKVKTNLSDNDFKNLVQAETMEMEMEKLSNSHAINYNNLLSLSRSYEVTTLQSDAEQIKHNFDSLSMINAQISKDISSSWSYIYDNKSFAYGVLVELLGFTDIMQKEAELMREAQAEISSKQDPSNELMRYLVQKNSMVKYESIIAEKLGLTSAVDSLNIVSTKLSATDKDLPLQPTIEERSFIVYEPIVFVNQTPYTTSNPIPETALYEKGVIFRIYVGSFQAKQSAWVFRNTTPVSYLINDKNRYCYYLGGFETFEQAEKAHAKLKARGFRVPQIVVWSDGVERNLTTDPLPMTSLYRLEILDATTLGDNVIEKVEEFAPNNPISKVGTDKFVIMSLERQSQADSLASELLKLDPSLNIVVGKSDIDVNF
ncbi:MAG: SPOR domain-containing protein [Rikenellaceae bacterium]